MSTTVLLVGHGSRTANSNPQIEKFASMWRIRNPSWRIELCFIEFADTLLDDGLDIAANDSTKVIVVPLILTAAGHVKVEIPAHIDKARARHPKVEYVYTPPLGAGEKILRILNRNLRKSMVELDVPDPKSTGIIVLARGSSDRTANGEIAKMARWLEESCDHELVDIAFTGVTYPRLEQVVQRHDKLGAKQVIVLPYYLFTGTLIERIDRQVLNLKQQYPNTRFATAGYFGFEPEVFSIIDQHVSNSDDSLQCAPEQEDLEPQHSHSHEHSHSHGAPE